MRSASVAVFVLLGLAAYAQKERELVRPRVSVPGEREYRDFTVPKDLEGDEAVKERVATLNKARAEKREGLKAKLAKLLEAQVELNQVVAELDQQDVAYYQFLATRAGGGQAGQYAVRLELQPVIQWLDLSEDQAQQLVNRQVQSGGMKLIELRRQITEAGREIARAELEVAKQGGPKPWKLPRTPEEVQQATQDAAAREQARQKQVALLTEYADLTKKWAENIKAVIKDDRAKMDKWTLRFGRTSHLLPTKP